jgi:serine/threonine protein kinase
MKADNAVVLGSLEEGYQVKLIDFGCFVRASPGNKYSQSIGDPDYMPPEHSVTSRAFEDPPSSFDIYGVGLIHLELLCPALQNTDWSPVHQMTQLMMMRGEKPVLSMPQVQSALMTRCPELFSRGFDGSDINQDVDLITQLTQLSPTARLTPEAALKHVAMEETHDLLVQMQFEIGDRVEYYSVSRNGWVPCIVSEVDRKNGFYDLVEEIDGRISPLKSQADPGRIRAVMLSESTPSLDKSFEVPQVELVFSEGDTVEYYSTTSGGWVACVISGVSRDTFGTGTYELALPDDRAFRSFVPPERVRSRSFPRGTKVWCFGSLAGIVLSFDAAKETYEVQKEGDTLTRWPNVRRDFVTPRN